MSKSDVLEQNCSYSLDFNDNKVFNEQMDILTYVQVCRIISFKINLVLTLIRTYEEKLKASESDDSELGILAFSNNLDSEDLS